MDPLGLALPREGAGTGEGTPRGQCPWARLWAHPPRRAGQPGLGTEAPAWPSWRAKPPLGSQPAGEAGPSPRPAVVQAPGGWTAGPVTGRHSAGHSARMGSRRQSRNGRRGPGRTQAGLEAPGGSGRACDRDCSVLSPDSPSDTAWSHQQRVGLALWRMSGTGSGALGWLWRGDTTPSPSTVSHYPPKTQTVPSPSPRLPARRPSPKSRPHLAEGHLLRGASGIPWGPGHQPRPDSIGFLPAFTTGSRVLHPWGPQACARAAQGPSLASVPVFKWGEPDLAGRPRGQGSVHTGLSCQGRSLRELSWRGEGERGGGGTPPTHTLLHTHSVTQHQPLPSQQAVHAGTAGPGPGRSSRAGGLCGPRPARRIAHPHGLPGAPGAGASAPALGAQPGPGDQGADASPRTRHGLAPWLGRSRRARSPPHKGGVKSWQVGAGRPRRPRVEKDL